MEGYSGELNGQISDLLSVLANAALLKCIVPSGAPGKFSMKNRVTKTKARSMYGLD